ncbi:hypothetical protein B0H17DRAFT_1132379 [Mycena rosella]|uniref:Uncharacterized protein n=1 Tax=Mycena rosella TaxID=1033263 RepID=A0AAD7DM96_MYCRO|nr:hypothetical protein B0H17DRAFT_1132379 [Mycena rosella]
MRAVDGYEIGSAGVRDGGQLPRESTMGYKKGIGVLPWGEEKVLDAPGRDAVDGDEARVDVDEARVDVDEARVDVDEARVDVDEARVDVDEARVDVDEARVDVDEARVDVDEARVDVDEARVDVDEARVDVDEARVDVDGSWTTDRTMRLDGTRVWIGWAGWDKGLLLGAMKVIYRQK